MATSLRGIRSSNVIQSWPDPSPCRVSPEGYFAAAYRPGPQAMALPSRLCSDRGSRGVAPLLIVADRLSPGPLGSTVAVWSGDPSRLIQS